MNAKLQGEWQERTVFGLTAETKWVADDAHNRNLIWCVLWFQITLKLTLPTAHYLSPTNLHLLHHRQAHGLVHLKLIYRDQINILPECHHGAEMLQGACTFRTLKPQRSWQYQTNNTLFLSYLLGRCRTQWHLFFAVQLGGCSILLKWRYSNDTSHTSVKLKRSVEQNFNLKTNHRYFQPFKEHTSIFMKFAHKMVPCSFKLRLEAVKVLPLQ